MASPSQHGDRHDNRGQVAAARPIIWVAEMLGHSPVEVTPRNYAHCIPREAEDMGFLGSLRGDRSKPEQGRGWLPLSGRKIWRARHDSNVRPLAPQIARSPRRNGELRLNHSRAPHMTPHSITLDGETAQNGDTSLASTAADDRVRPSDLCLKVKLESV